MVQERLQNFLILACEKDLTGLIDLEDVTMDSGDLDPVYTRTDPKWYGSILDPFQILLAFTLDRIQIRTPFTLGTGLEQFYSNT